MVDINELGNLLQFKTIICLNRLLPESVTVHHVPGKFAAQGEGKDVGEGLEERDHPNARPQNSGKQKLGHDQADAGLNDLEMEKYFQKLRLLEIDTVRNIFKFFKDKKKCKIAFEVDNEILFIFFLIF